MLSTLSRGCVRAHSMCALCTLSSAQQGPPAASGTSSHTAAASNTNDFQPGHSICRRAASCTSCAGQTNGRGAAEPEGVMPIGGLSHVCMAAGNTRAANSVSTGRQCVRVQLARNCAGSTGYHTGGHNVTGARHYCCAFLPAVLLRLTYARATAGPCPAACMSAVRGRTSGSGCQSSKQAVSAQAVCHGSGSTEALWLAGRRMHVSSVGPYSRWCLL